MSWPKSIAEKLIWLVPVFIQVLVPFGVTQDTGCPGYPAAARADFARSLDTQRQFFFRPKPRLLHADVVTPPSKNFIDDSIFKKMVADNVPPAPLTNDSEFVRRIYLDLTGRIPTFEQTNAFLADTSPNNRDKLIDTLLASPDYVDQ